MIGVPTEPQSADWRARQREFAVAEIKAIARRQIGEDGAIALSMGRIAREMGLTPPALYRYFPSRNALVNALVLDAYRDLSRETAQSLVGVPDDAVGTRFERMVTAYRYWAIARPQEYVLIHGALFHSYRAPVVEIVEAAFGCLRLFVDVLSRAEAQGTLHSPSAYDAVSARFGAILSLHAESAALPPNLVTLAYVVWLQVHALVWQELAGHLPAALFQDGELYRAHIRTLAQNLGLSRADEVSE